MQKVFKIFGSLLLLMVIFSVGYIGIGPDITVYSHTDEKSCQNTDEQESCVLPVIMYHQILKNGKSDYIITPNQLEKDLIELKKRGYETVLPREVIAYVNGNGKLPDKPIMITFDDGHYNNIFYGQNLLEKYDCRAVLNIIGKYSEHSTESGDHSKPAYSHLTWTQIADAEKSGTFEIGNHTYNMHNYKTRHGVLQKTNESDEEYKQNLTNDITKLQEILAIKSGVKPICFAYPFGRYKKLTKQTVKDCGFKMIFNCYETRNLIVKGNIDKLYNICRFNRNPKYSSSSFFDMMEKSKISE